MSHISLESCVFWLFSLNYVYVSARLNNFLVWKQQIRLFLYFKSLHTIKGSFFDDFCVRVHEVLVSRDGTVMFIHLTKTMNCMLILQWFISVRLFGLQFLGGPDQFKVA